MSSKRAKNLVFVFIIFKSIIIAKEKNNCKKLD